jgi:hypothetical protein
MATRCPNCDLVLGWRLVPGFSTTWRCRCGVTVDHTGSSFLEAWVRAAILTGIALGAAAIFVLHSRGVIAPTPFGQLSLLAAGVGLTLAAGLSTLVGPLVIVVAKCLGIPFSTREKIGAAATPVIALVSCVALAAVTQEALRTRVDFWPRAGGNVHQAVVENKK